MPVMLTLNESPLSTLASLLDELGMDLMRQNNPVFLQKTKTNAQFIDNMIIWASDKYPHAVFNIQTNSSVSGYLSAPDWLLLKYYAHLASEKSNSHARKINSSSNKTYLPE